MGSPQPHSVTGERRTKVVAGRVSDLEHELLRLAAAAVGHDAPTTFVTNSGVARAIRLFSGVPYGRDAKIQESAMIKAGRSHLLIMAKRAGHKTVRAWSVALGLTDAASDAGGPERERLRREP